MPTIRLCKQTKVTILVSRKEVEEGLDQVPDIWSCTRCRVHVLRSIREANPDWLINVEHIGIFIEAMRVMRWCRLSSIGKYTWAVFL